MCLPWSLPVQQCEMFVLCPFQNFNPTCPNILPSGTLCFSPRRQRLPSLAAVPTVPTQCPKTTIKKGQTQQLRQLSHRHIRCPNTVTAIYPIKLSRTTAVSWSQAQIIHISASSFCILLDCFDW